MLSSLLQFHQALHPDQKLVTTLIHTYIVVLHVRMQIL